MQRHEDGSVLLGADEVSAVAKVLELGRQLCEDMDAAQSESENAVEVQLLETIDLLDELGVSSEELTEKLETDRDRR